MSHIVIRVARTNLNSMSSVIYRDLKKSYYKIYCLIIHVSKYIQLPEIDNTVIFREKILPAIILWREILICNSFISHWCTFFLSELRYEIRTAIRISLNDMHSTQTLSSYTQINIHGQKLAPKYRCRVEQ